MGDLRVVPPRWTRPWTAWTCATRAGRKRRRSWTPSRRVFARCSIWSLAGSGRCGRTSTVPPCLDGVAAPITVALAETVRVTNGMSAAPFLDMIAGMRDDLRPDVSFDDAPSAPSCTATESPGRWGSCALVVGLQPRCAIEARSNLASTWGSRLSRATSCATRGRTRAAARGICPWICSRSTSGSRGRRAGERRRRSAALVESVRRHDRRFDRARRGALRVRQSALEDARAASARLPVLAAAEMYGALLAKVRDAEYDNVSKRAFTTTRASSAPPARRDARLVRKVMK